MFNLISNLVCSIVQKPFSAAVGVFAMPIVLTPISIQPECVVTLRKRFAVNTAIVDAKATLALKLGSRVKQKTDGTQNKVPLYSLDPTLRSLYKTTYYSYLASHSNVESNSSSVTLAEETLLATILNDAALALIHERANAAMVQATLEELLANVMLDSFFSIVINDAAATIVNVAVVQQERVANADIVCGALQSVTANVLISGTLDSLSTLTSSSNLTTTDISLKSSQDETLAHLRSEEIRIKTTVDPEEESVFNYNLIKKSITESLPKMEEPLSIQSNILTVELNPIGKKMGETPVSEPDEVFIYSNESKLLLDSPSSSIPSSPNDSTAISSVTDNEEGVLHLAAYPPAEVSPPTKQEQENSLFNSLHPVLKGREKSEYLKIEKLRPIVVSTIVTKTDKEPPHLAALPPAEVIPPVKKASDVPLTSGSSAPVDVNKEDEGFDYIQSKKDLELTKEKEKATTSNHEVIKSNLRSATKTEGKVVTTFTNEVAAEVARADQNSSAVVALSADAVTSPMSKEISVTRAGSTRQTPEDLLIVQLASSECSTSSLSSSAPSSPLLSSPASSSFEGRESVDDWSEESEALPLRHFMVMTRVSPPLPDVSDPPFFLYLNSNASSSPQSTTSSTATSSSSFTVATKFGKQEFHPPINKLTSSMETWKAKLAEIKEKGGGFPSHFAVKNTSTLRPTGRIASKALKDLVKGDGRSVRK